MSRVDVIVPCYKYGHFLRECVGSALAQDGVDVRVLIIDDASPDDSAEVAAGLAAGDARVEVRRHAANRGHIATYNEGLDWAAGDYLLLLSADDVLTPGALGRAARLMDAHPEVGFTFGRAITTDKPDFRNHLGVETCRSRILSGAEFWAVSCAEASNVVSTPTAVVRTWLQKKVGGYRAELPHTGDLEMWMRFAAHAPVGVLDADQAFYRVHGHNMHVDTFPQRITVLEQHRRAFEILFREYGERFEGRDRLRRMAMRAVALGGVRAAGKLFERGDPASCERLSQAALAVFPELRQEWEWSRLGWKRLLGRRVVKAVRRLRGALCKPAPVDRSPFGRCGVFEGV
jgi:glycosyltransferase involved in cell wall biosynthesis